MKRAVIIVALIASFVAGVAAYSAIAIYRSPMPEVPAMQRYRFGIQLRAMLLPGTLW